MVYFQASSAGAPKEADGFFELMFRFVKEREMRRLHGDVAKLRFGLTIATN